MFSWRFVVLAAVPTGLVSIGLVALVGTPLLTAVSTGLGVGALAVVLSSALRDGRFPGAMVAGRARLAMGVTSFLVLAAVFPGVSALNLEGSTDLSAKLLILVTGYAAYFLGSATVIWDLDKPN